METQFIDGVALRSRMHLTTSNTNTINDARTCA